MKSIFWSTCLVSTLALVGCGGKSSTESAEASNETPSAPMTYAQDAEFLKKHTDAIVLGEDEGPSLVVVPAYQGRVMTSSHDAKSGDGNGWINHELIGSGKTNPHINAFGGEDRFWMGPEGGQFAIYFKPGTKFVFDDWQTPAFIDTDKYKVTKQSKTEVVCEHTASIENYSGTKFDLHITRGVTLLGADAAEKHLGIRPGDGVKMVGYETSNTVKNAGQEAWTKDKGLLSIWILGMFKHSPTTTVVLPYKTGDEATMGPIVTDTYFGKVPEDRLKIADGLIYFKGDGQYRSKIGVNPQRSKPIIGSYDPGRNLLTIVQYTLPAGATDYVNSMWEVQEKPFGGDVVNSYNDGPVDGGKPLGPFYELETSSPALALKPGEAYTHHSRTFHFRGDRAALQALATKLLGANLDQVAQAFAPKSDQNSG